MRRRPPPRFPPSIIAAVKPVEKFLCQGPLADLRIRAQAHARLQADVFAQLPEWMDPAAIEVELAAGGVLVLTAPPAAARMLTQQRASLQAALAESGVRTVAVRRRR